MAFIVSQALECLERLPSKLVGRAGKAGRMATARLSSVRFRRARGSRREILTSSSVLPRDAAASAGLATAARVGCVSRTAGEIRRAAWLLFRASASA